MSTELKDTGKETTAAFEAAVKGVPKIEEAVLISSISDFLGRVFSNASQKADGQPVGLYTSSLYQTKFKKTTGAINLQLTQQLMDSIGVGVTDKKENAIGFLTTHKLRVDKIVGTNTGQTTIYATDVDNDELADILDDKYGIIFAFSEKEKKDAQEKYLFLFNKKVVKELDKRFKQ